MLIELLVETSITLVEAFVTAKSARRAIQVLRMAQQVGGVISHTDQGGDVETHDKARLLVAFLLGYKLTLPILVKLDPLLGKKVAIIAITMTLADDHVRQTQSDAEYISVFSARLGTNLAKLLMSEDIKADLSIEQRWHHTTHAMGLAIQGAPLLDASDGSESTYLLIDIFSALAQESSSWSPQTIEWLEVLGLDRKTLKLFRHTLRNPEASKWIAGLDNYNRDVLFRADSSEFLSSPTALFSQYYLAQATSDQVLSTLDVGHCQLNAFPLLSKKRYVAYPNPVMPRLAITKQATNFLIQRREIQAGVRQEELTTIPSLQTPGVESEGVYKDIDFSLLNRKTADFSDPMLSTADLVQFAVVGTRILANQGTANKVAKLYDSNIDAPTIKHVH